MLAAVFAVLLLGGVAAWGLTRGGGAAGSGTTVGAGEDPTLAAAPSADAVLRQAGFTPCGKAFCSVTPLCWSGLTDISGNAMPPAQIDCTDPHYWETFAAVRLPADADPVHTSDALLKRADLRAACSAAVMASRSRHPSATRSWIRDAWPISLAGGGTWLVHCLARSPSGESTGSAFRP